MILLLSTMVSVSAAVAVSGGLRGPFWILYLPALLFAATTLKQWQAVLLGVANSVSLVIAALIAHSVDSTTVAWLVLVLPIFPALTWFNSALSQSIWAMRAMARAERDELQSRVAELSEVLAQAAEGDLSVGMARDDADHEALELLAAAFTNTVTNLRALVTQIRTGGEQIGAAAGELLDDRRGARGLRDSAVLRGDADHLDDRGAGGNRGADRRDLRGCGPLCRGDLAARRRRPGRGPVERRGDGHDRQPGRLDRRAGALAR